MLTQGEQIVQRLIQDVKSLQTESASLRARLPATIYIMLETIENLNLPRDNAADFHNIPSTKAWSQNMKAENWMVK